MNISASFPDPSSNRPRIAVGTMVATASTLLFVTLAFSAVAPAQAQSPIRGPRHSGVYPGALPPASTPAPPQATPTAPTPSPAPAASPLQPAQPESLLQQPPKQANIETQPNSLAIKADNASLTQTLQRIADKTGMHLEGISGDQRIFGDFGPGAPRDVLNTLLTGTGYNIVMIGALDNGAPRQLILSQKKTETTGAAPVQQQAVSSFDDDPPPDAPPPPDDSPGQPPAHGGEAANGRGIRTPQQMLEQMQQMRQQQADQPPQQ